MRRARFAVALLVLGFASSARAQEELSSDQWNEVIGFVDQMLGTAKSGSNNARDLGLDLAVSVVPQRAVSRSTGAICGTGCFDPCRDFDLSVSREDGRAIYRYSGRRCATSTDFSAWREEGPIRLDRILRPGPDPELVRRAAAYLAVLAYLPNGSGQPDASQTMAALREFRTDAMSGAIDDEDITDEDIAALRATIDRSGRSAACTLPPTARYSACGASSF